MSHFWRVSRGTSDDIGEMLADACTIATKEKARSDRSGCRGLGRDVFGQKSSTHQQRLIVTPTSRQTAARPPHGIGIVRKKTLATSCWTSKQQGPIDGPSTARRRRTSDPRGCHCGDDFCGDARNRPAPTGMGGGDPSFVIGNKQRHAVRGKHAQHQVVRRDHSVCFTPRKLRTVEMEHLAP